MKHFLKSTGQEVFMFPWVAESPRPWPVGYHRVYLPTKERHKSGTIGHVLIVKSSNLESKK